MSGQKKGWGTRSAWAMSFFDMVPSPSLACSGEPCREIAAAPSSSSSSSSPIAASANASAKAAANALKRRKRMEIDPQTRWRCRRCGEVFLPPLDAATGKPRSGVMMCEHLEGVSSGGTTHLATGVAVCARGTIRYDKLATASGEGNTHATCSPCTIQPTVESGHERKGENMQLPVSQDANKDGARTRVLNLLRECQRAALEDSKAGHAGCTARGLASLIFVVVENPKTPANAGGILRAMKCYGVHGPSMKTTAASVSASDPAASTMHAEDAVTPSQQQQQQQQPSDSSGSAEGVLRRLGAFIFSGTRLQKALVHTDFASTLRTDPTHAGRDIPQLCLPSLDTLFEVLKSEYGHRASSPSASRNAAVRVVAVELVEGATLLPAYQHPFEVTDDASASVGSRLVEKDVANRRVFTVPMVFYVFGAEDGTLSAHHIEHDVDDVVFMPTTGSMNLAATVNVLLYDRVAKECCGMQPATAPSDATSAEGVAREPGKKWKEVFENRNSNNRTRWTRPS